MTKDNQPAGHTAGPWSIVDRRDLNEALWICVNHPEVGEVSIAEVRDGCDEAAETGSMEANARLIASAPDLLAFAISHDRYMLDAGYEGPDDPALHPNAAENWRMCRAALRRAQPEQSA